jgi:hypothetical protein
MVEVVSKRNGCEVGANQHVDQKQQEVLPVPKTHAVVDPGTVVVHIQNAPVAGRTVVAPFWLEDVAHQTVTSSFILIVT